MAPMRPARLNPVDAYLQRQRSEFIRWTLLLWTLGPAVLLACAICWFVFGRSH